MSDFNLEAWVGKTETRSDMISPWPIAALCAALDGDEVTPREGDPLPPAWHWLYFLEAKRGRDLGPDGHPKRGGFLPPIELPRRMWAGGRMEFIRPLRVGSRAQRKSEVASIQRKQGASGDLVFVTLRHSISDENGLAINEEQDLVYRGQARRDDLPPKARPAPTSVQWQRTLAADPVFLFRYSALTFNGHRIHYDIDYARKEENYPALVVHAPLQTTLLLELCRTHERRPIVKIEYRALHPVFHTERFTVNGNLSADGSSAALWTANDAGMYAMSATAYF